MSRAKFILDFACIIALCIAATGILVAVQLAPESLVVAEGFCILGVVALFVHAIAEYLL